MSRRHTVNDNNNDIIIIIIITIITVIVIYTDTIHPLHTSPQHSLLLSELTCLCIRSLV